MLDSVPTSLLKECKSELMSIITKIVNLSIETGEMPNDFKHAVITPLHSAPQKEGIRAYLQKLLPGVWITLLIQSHSKGLQHSS